MPVHDWSLVDAGIFHAFHHNWVTDISAALNAGLLPDDYYALPEQVAGGLGPDVLTLKSPQRAEASKDRDPGVALADAPPKVKMRFKSEPDSYAAKAKSVVIRHTSRHQVIAILEIVSPGNKSARHALRAFVEKAVDIVRAGVHLLVIDLHPPGPRDPQGVHKAIWDEFIDNDFELPADKRLTLASYLAGDYPEAFVEPIAVDDRLVDMPLFLSQDAYVPTPLESTYAAAFAIMPAYWRDVLSK